MYKVNKLKKWLTLPEASKQLSALLDEKVKTKDLLRLALDDSLQISVFFANGIPAMKWEVVSLREAQKILSLDGQSTLVMGFALNSDQILQSSSDEVLLIDGLWDLAMLGAEKKDIEDEYFRRVNGPDIEIFNLDGVFVKSLNGEYYQLQARYDSRVEIGHDESRRNIFYYPLERLPATESMLVVRPDSISKFIEKILLLERESEQAIKHVQEKPITEKKEKTYQSIIGALLCLLLYHPKKNRTQDSIMDEVETLFPVHGLSKENLKKYFQAANKALRERQKS